MFKNLAALLACASILGASAQKEGTVLLTTVDADAQYGDISLIVDFTENTGNVDYSKVSGQVTPAFSDMGAGNFELCFYENGGITRDLEVGNIFTAGSFTGCTGEILDSNLAISAGTATGATLTKSVATSMIGRAAVLCKRSIVVIVDTVTAGTALTVALKNSGGNTIVSQTITTGTNHTASAAATVFTFDSNPTGDYTLEITNNPGSETLVIGEYQGSSKYWKSYMVTALNTASGVSGTAEAYPAILDDYPTLAADGWRFPSSSTLSVTVATSVLSHAATGTIGIKNRGVGTTNEAGGLSGGKIRCEFDDQWGTRAIFGQGLLTEWDGENKFWLQSQISGLQCGGSSTGCNHSFHFHMYGDITDGDGAGQNSPNNLGSIVSTYSLKPLELSGSSSSVYYHTNVTIPGGSTFDDILGVSLTIHDGPLTANDTVAWGVCGVAASDACMRYGCPDAEYENVDTNEASSRSAASLLILIAAALPMLRMFD